MHCDAGTVTAGGGVTGGALMRATARQGLPVPLGARPAVGAGVGLNGGLGPLSRKYGMSCDHISGLTYVSVITGGCVLLGTHAPNIDKSEMKAAHDEIFWGFHGAGTNLEVILSVTFRAVKATAAWLQNTTITIESSNKGAESPVNIAKKSESLPDQ